MTTQIRERAKSIQVNLADHALAESAPRLHEGADGGHTWRGIYPTHDAAEVLVEGSRDGADWTVLFDGSGTGEDRPHALIVLDEPHPLRFIRVTARALPFGGAFAVSGLRLFGHGEGSAPPPVAADAVRLDALTARLTWNAAAGAHGYNIRYGASPDKLYRSWLVYDRTHLDAPSLNADQETWFAVDSFNQNGVTLGQPALLRGGV